MSNTPESGASELGLDLDLHFLPAWAQRAPTENIYSNYEGERDRDRSGPGGRRRDRDRDRGDRGPRREFRGDRPPRSGDGGQRAPRRHGGRPGPGQRPEREVRPEVQPAQVQISVVPEEKGVESLARQIRLSGRAYPLFDIAQLVLKKPDRYQVRFEVIKKADGQVAQPLFLCQLDETLWLNERQAIDHVFANHFATFYQTERLPADPPKGTYTFVAQCGITGSILGPPNYHDYQTKLRKLHAERFSRMPFETYKSRIRIVRDEAIVKKWLEEQSWRNEYICLNVPEELRLTSREEVEAHFREHHLPNVVKQVENHVLSGSAAFELPCRPLQLAVRRFVEDQARFPIKVVNVLSQQFANHGLQFFKVNKSITHVAVARPRYLDLDATPVSDGVRRIVDFVENHPNCTRRQLLDELAPLPAHENVPGTTAAAAVEPPSEPAPTDAPAATAESAAAESPAASTAEPAAQPAPQARPQTTPEREAAISDLHWLLHQGHVIEFANGILENAKKPAPKPQRQPKADAAAETTSSSAGAGEIPSGGAVSEPAPSAEADASGTESSPADATLAADVALTPSTESQPEAASESTASAEPSSNADTPGSEPEAQPSSEVPPSPESEPPQDSPDAPRAASM